MYGEVGVATVSPNCVIKFWNMATRVFVLRVGRENEQMVCNSLILMNNFSSTPCRIRIVHVSGTLQKLEDKIKLLNESWLSNQESQIEKIEATMQ